MTGLYGKNSNFKYTYYSFHLRITICFSDYFDHILENEKLVSFCKPLPVKEQKESRHRKCQKIGMCLTEHEGLSMLDTV